MGLYAWSALAEPHAVFWVPILSSIGLIFLVAAFALQIINPKQNPAVRQAAFITSAVPSVLLTGLGVIVLVGSLTIEPNTACAIWGSILTVLFGTSTRYILRQAGT
jgi:hypothetical protein